ncbi:MAG: hypothetical protein Q7T55_11825 [Solirubrobacteraceae bacterium]|nr:hypothetical protein [Solirubrobacteraceae bacterium]
MSSDTHHPESGRSRTQRFSWPAATGLTFLIFAVAVAIRTAIPDDGIGWQIADIIVFAVSLATLFSVWNHTERPSWARRRTG